MNRNVFFLMISMLATSPALISQTSHGPSSLFGLYSFSSEASESMSQVASPVKYDPANAPFSRLAFGGGISLMGVDLQMATNINRHLNLRGTGNFFRYTVSSSNIDASGFSLNGQINFATAGVSVDYYPFPTHGFRLSPGLLFYNDNQIKGGATGLSGSSIVLNSTNYNSETADPIVINGALALNTHKQAFTISTGWGNVIPRRGGHWSFPFELGAAFTGTPSLNLLIAGYGCTNRLDVAISGPSCVNMATDANAQANLNSEISKWTKKLNALQVYPIFSFGASYAFRFR
ncbi:MAG: hypothetical protein WA802_06910 [Terracidiphilus sp.]